MTSAADAGWITPYVSYIQEKRVGTLEFKNLSGSGRMAPRHLMDVCKHQNQMMDVASDAAQIVVAIDPGWTGEASYIVNNLLCAVLRAERSKIKLQPSNGAEGSAVVYFFEQNLPAATAIQGAKRTKHRKVAHHVKPKPHRVVLF